MSYYSYGEGLEVSFEFSFFLINYFVKSIKAVFTDSEVLEDTS